MVTKLYQISEKSTKLEKSNGNDSTMFSPDLVPIFSNGITLF